MTDEQSPPELTRQWTDENWSNWRSRIEADEEHMFKEQDLAVLAYVLDLAAGLTDQMRREMLGEEHGWPWGSTAKGLHKRRLMVSSALRGADWRKDWRTPLGRAVSRVLEESK